MLTLQLLVETEDRFEDLGTHRQPFASAKVLFCVMHELNQTLGKFLALVVLKRIADHVSQAVSGSLDKDIAR